MALLARVIRSAQPRKARADSSMACLLTMPLCRLLQAPLCFLQAPLCSVVPDGVAASVAATCGTMHLSSASQASPSLGCSYSCSISCWSSQQPALRNTMHGYVTQRAKAVGWPRWSLIDYIRDDEPCCVAQAAQSWLPQPQTAHCRAADSLLAGKGSSRVISKGEVAEHNTMESGVWVTHKARRRKHD